MCYGLHIGDATLLSMGITDRSVDLIRSLWCRLLKILSPQYLTMLQRRSATNQDVTNLMEHLWLQYRREQRALAVRLRDFVLSTYFR